MRDITRSRRSPGRVVWRIALPIFGLLSALLLGEAGLRAVAPFLSLYVRAFVQEEAYQQAQSALRVAKGAQIILRETDFEKPVDVLAVGDSMVFGSLVKEQELWTTHLSRQTGLVVLNLGVPAQAPCGYNHMLKVALERLAARPSIVLYTLFANDFAEPSCSSMPDEKLFIWRKTYQDSLGLRLRMMREWLLQHSVSYQLLKNLLTLGHVQWGGYFTPVPFENGRSDFLFAPVSYWRPQIDLGIPEVAEGFARTFGKIQQATALCERAGATLVVVLMPFKEQVYVPWLVAQGALPPETYDASYDVLYDTLLGRTHGMGVPTVDLRPDFREAARRGARLYWRVDGHLTPAGHELVATVLTDTLRHLWRSER